jgi:WD40 repeat protein
MVEPLRANPAPATKVCATAFNRHGTRCAAGYEDGLVRVWDFASGALITECRPGKFAVDAITFLGDGNEFVTNIASATGKLEIWSCGTSPATPIRTVEKVGAAITELLSAPDGNSFVVLGLGGRAWLCDKSGQIRKDLAELAGGQIYAAAFSPDGARIAVAGAAVQFFDPRAEQFGAKSPPVGGGRVQSLVVRPDGGVNATIKDAARTVVRQFTPDLGSFDVVPIESHRATLALGGDGETLLLSTGDQKQLRLGQLPALGRRSIAINESAVFGSVSASSDGQRIATLIQPGHLPPTIWRFQIAIWNAATLEQTAVSLSLPNGAFPTALAHDPESASIAIGCEAARDSHGEVLLGQPLPDGPLSFQLLGSNSRPVGALAFAPGGRDLFSGSHGAPSDPTAEIVHWDTAVGAEIGRVMHSAPIFALAVSPDGRWLAVGDIDGSVTLLPADTLDSSKVIRLAVGAPVGALAFSPLGDQLACGTAKGRVVILRRDGDRLTPVCEPIQSGASISAVRFGADPRLVFVSTNQPDSGVTAWNTDLGRAVGPALPVPGVIRDLAAPANGSAIISLTSDGRLTMIPLTPATAVP